MILRFFITAFIFILTSCSTEEEKEEQKMSPQQEADLQNAQFRQKAADAAVHQKVNRNKFSSHNDAVVFATTPEIKGDKEKFKKVLKQAVKGDPDYQYSLAMCYKYGYVVKPDKNKALFWFKKAADQGHKQAERVYNFMMQRK